MRYVAKISIVCLLVTNSSSAYATPEVGIVVRVPAETPENSSIYVAGSLSSVGNWKADGVKLTRQDNGTYSGNVVLTTGQTLEFKITRGSWDTVEKNIDGSERANRTAVAEGVASQIDITVERWASDSRDDLRQACTVIGVLKLHMLDSKALKLSRTIRVWLPPGYDDNPNARYDVLYMQDGQNCFDRATSAFGNEWEIDETLTKLIGNNVIRPLIVVGIDNGQANRINEYSYDADPKHGGGQGLAYAEFLLTEVKPFIEETYRVQKGRAHTLIGGSSLGGLISLEIAWRNPDTFGGVIAMSPAIWWADQTLIAKIERDPGGLAGARVWIDMGSRENVPLSTSGVVADQSQRYIDAAHRLDAALAKHRIDHRFVIDDQHAEHNEPAWASRFPQAISYGLETGNESGQPPPRKPAK